MGSTPGAAAAFNGLQALLRLYTRSWCPRVELSAARPAISMVAVAGVGWGSGAVPSPGMKNSTTRAIWPAVGGVQIVRVLAISTIPLTRSSVPHWTRTLSCAVAWSIAGSLSISGKTSTGHDEDIQVQALQQGVVDTYGGEPGLFQWAGSFSAHPKAVRRNHVPSLVSL